MTPKPAGMSVSDEAVRAAAGALHSDRYGWNAPHAGILEGAHRASSEHDARVAVAAAVPYIEAEIRAAAMKEAANEVHIEARWQEELLQRGVVEDRAAFVERLLILQRIFLDRAARVARGTQETPE